MSTEKFHSNGDKPIGSVATRATTDSGARTVSKQRGPHVSFTASSELAKPSPGSTRHRCDYRSIDALEQALSEPTDQVVETLARLQGDILILGVGGKMGPTLARMAKRASNIAGSARRVIGVARFSDPAIRGQLEEHGIETVSGNLLNQEEVDNLPDAENVIFMAGLKFGSTARAAETWAMNCLTPQLVCRRFSRSRLVAFSTGNVYGLTSTSGDGSREGDPLSPLGEYAMSCLGRERMFEHFSRVDGIPMALLRLNYACEMRYGVLVDLAEKVWAGHPIDLTMGYFNVIWQADANAIALCALGHVDTPPLVLNVSGTEQVRVRDACETLGRLLGKTPHFVGRESPDALLNDSRLSQQLFGSPRWDASELMEGVAAWIKGGGQRLGKPTLYEVVDGRF